MTSKDNIKLNALILCGGKSTRMGKSKAHLQYYGLPQYEYLYQLLKPYVNEVYISTNTGTFTVNFNTIVDQFQINSPLNGLLSACHAIPDTAWLVVACDMPLINTYQIKKLLTNRNLSKLATCFLGTDNKPHPLFTIYEKECFEKMKLEINQNISPRNFLMNNNTEIIDSKNKTFLKNVNTKTEYDEMMLYINKHKP